MLSNLLILYLSKYFLIYNKIQFASKQIKDLSKLFLIEMYCLRLDVLIILDILIFELH
jgi:hypothetical protein